MEPCLCLAGGLMDYTAARNPKNEISVDVITAKRGIEISTFIKTMVPVMLFNFWFQIVPFYVLFLCGKFDWLENKISSGYIFMNISGKILFANQLTFLNI